MNANKKNINFGKVYLWKKWFKLLCLIQKKRKKKKEKIIITIVCLNFKNARIRGYIKHFSDAKSMSFLIEDKKL